MQFYGLGYQQTLELPIQVFWMMNYNIQRIKSGDDLRLLSLSVATQASGEAATQFRENLVIEHGAPVVENPAARQFEKMQEGAIDKLKMLSR